jgi:hypothetical protein
VSCLAWRPILGGGGRRVKGKRRAEYCTAGGRTVGYEPRAGVA